MFAQVKQIFNPSNKGLRKKILFTFFALFVFKLGTSIIVPGIDSASLSYDSLGFFELINAMGGGALERFSIFALGVMPYISASIIVQLLQADIVPYFSDLAKQGGTGRTKLNRITRYLGITLAFIQGYVFSFAFVSSGSAADYLSFAIILTAGTAFLLWLGDQISAKGVGNGISVLIMAGIISNIPNMFYQTWNSLVDFSTVQVATFGVVKFALFLVVYVAIILGIIFIETSERRIAVQYTNKTIASTNSSKSYIPFKLNSAGVMPVIFASIIISVPGIISTVLNNESVTLFVNNYLTLTSVVGFILYIACIFSFTYFYTFFQLKPDKVAEDINKSSGFIPGVRPGQETEKYLIKVLKRITLIGATSLSIIASIPVIFGMIPSLPSSVRIGGTSLLIVVGVALEIYKQISSELITRSYSRGIKR